MQHSFSLTNPDSDASLIIVMGVSGSGKTTVAKAVADHYGYDFLDGDDFHSQESRDLMAQGIPLTDAHRLPWVIRMRDYFREAAIRGQSSTLAFSGLKRVHRDELRKTGLKTIFIFLYSDKDTIQTRVNKRAGHFMSPKLVDSQFESLEDPSNEADVYRIDVRDSLDQVVSHTIDVINRELHRQPNACLAVM